MFGVGQNLVFVNTKYIKTSKLTQLINDIFFLWKLSLRVREVSWKIFDFKSES